MIYEASHDPLIPLITTIPYPCDAEQAQAFINRQHGRLSSGEGYSFAISRSETSVAVGQIGLWFRNIHEGRASIGYFIVASKRRKGAAQQALDSISRWGLTFPAIRRLELYIEPWNEGSWRTAEKVGYQREGLLRSWQSVGGEGRDMYMYSLLASDIQKS